MATFLDIGILSYFQPILVFLLVFVLLYALLEVTKVFGEGKKGVNSLLALFIALIMTISGTGTKTVTSMLPWFIVSILFIFFTLFIVRMFGLGDKDISNIIKDKAVWPWIVVLLILILISSLSGVFGQSLLSAGSGTAPPPQNTVSINSTSGLPVYGTGTATPSFSTNLVNTLRHPKVLGLILVFLIAALSILFLTKPHFE